MFPSKVVAITGAAGGIGRALCKYFGDEGAKIGAVDQSPAVRDLAAALAKEGIAVDAEVADVGVPAEVARAFEQLSARLGSVDLLVNNAGFSNHPTLAQTDPQLGATTSMGTSTAPIIALTLSCRTCGKNTPASSSISAPSML